MALLVLASVAHAGIYLVAAPEHVVDASWPLHARFHVLQALLWAVGFDVAVLVTVLGPLRRGDRWAWWALVAAGVFLHGSYFVSMAALPEGRPPGVLPHLGLGAVLVLFGAGLALARKMRVS